MPIQWDGLSPSERAEEVLRNVEGLTRDDKAAIYDEWAQGEYADTATGRIQADADLQQIAVRHLLKRLGRWGDEKERLRKERMRRTSKQEL